MLPVIILGGIFGGLVTATEGAGPRRGRGAGHRRRDLPRAGLARLKEAMIEGGVQTAVVMLLVAASALVGVYLTEQQVPQKLAACDPRA